MNEFDRDIILGDALEEIRLIPGSSVDCVYADPDYNVGIRYGNKAYRKKFDEYIDWSIEWSTEAHRVLKDTGNFFIINYSRNMAHLRVRCLDELFYDVHEYVWAYNTNIGHSPRRFTLAHRTILHCRKSKNNNWFKSQVAEEYKNPTDRRIQENISQGSPGRMPYSWQYFDLVKNVSREKTDHACQIPEGLSELLFKASMKEGDHVVILFGGSGSEVLSAIRLGLRFTAFEIDADYHRLIRKRVNRLLQSEEAQVRPLEAYTDSS